MAKIKSSISYFSKSEKVLWISSILLIFILFAVFDRENYMTLAASVIGATSLIFNSKGNPIGQVLMVVFSIFYGIISYSFSYYGEMITYLVMTAPMSIFALVSWLRNPYNGKRSEVKVNSIKMGEVIFMLFLTAVITFVFYFILKFFHSANLLLSTLSITTSFLAVYLTFRRSAFFALAYAANDIVLIVLWILAALSDISYHSVIICFLTFLVNDTYGFINWLRMQKRQQRCC